MALRNLEIVVVVKDNASKQLDGLNKKIKKTGDAAKGANADYTKFNRTLFSAVALIGTYVKALSTLHTSIEGGADLDRIERQYERVLGKKGTLFQALDNITTTGIDKFEAMKEGITLGNLGIVHSSDQLANILAKAATAAKMAGKDSTEGMQAIAEFMKTGEISQLQFLDVIAKTNPALQAQMAILHKAGGVMGEVISTQARLALGTSLLDAVTRGHLKDQIDLVDVLKVSAFSFSFLRKEIGLVIGSALAPLIMNVSKFIEKMTMGIEHLSKTNKNFIPFVKNVLIATIAMTGLVTALGTLRLVTMALSSLGLGLPVLAAVFLVLERVISNTHDKTKKLTDMFKTFLAIGQGIWELITSFDDLTGKSKISKSVLDALGGPESPLFKIVHLISRLGIITMKVIDAVVEDFTWLAAKVKDVAKAIANFFGKNLGQDGVSELQTTWGRFWIDTLPKYASKGLELIAALWLGSKVFKMFGGGNFFSGMLGKVPGIGKLFGGGKADGSKSNPFYVIVVGGAGGGEGLKGLGKTALSLGQLLKNGIANVAIVLGSSMTELVAMFGMAGTVAITAAGVALAAGIGILLGKLIENLIEKYTQGETKEGFKGSIVERGMFKASQFFGTESAKQFNANMAKANAIKTPEGALQAQFEHAQKMGWSKPGETLEQYKARVEAKRGNASLSPGSGDKSVAVVPNSSPTEEAMIDTIGEGIKGIHDKTQRNKAEISAETTLDTLGQSGQALTPDSMEQIMKDINRPSIELLSKIEDNTSKDSKDNSVNYSRRR